MYYWPGITLLISYRINLLVGPVTLCVYLSMKRDIQNKQNLELINQYRLKYGNRLNMTMYSSEDNYPVNILRNRAIELVKTELIINLDIDFIPDAGLYDYILNNYAFLVEGSESKGFVIPALSYVPPDFNPDTKWQLPLDMLPKTKAEVAKAIQDKIFIYEHWEEAQRVTDIPKWLTANELYKTNYSEWYEPYIITNMRYQPAFDERYIYYGNDKNQWNYHLSFLGLEYWVIPDHFITHMPHKKNIWAGDERKSVLPLVKKWGRDFVAEIKSFHQRSQELSITDANKYWFL